MKAKLKINDIPLTSEEFIITPGKPGSAAILGKGNIHTRNVKAEMNVAAFKEFVFIRENYQNLDPTRPLKFEVTHDDVEMCSLHFLLSGGLNWNGTDCLGGQSALWLHNGMEGSTTEHSSSVPTDILVIEMRRSFVNEMMSKFEDVLAPLYHQCADRHICFNQPNAGFLTQHTPRVRHALETIASHQIYGNNAEKVMEQTILELFSEFVRVRAGKAKLTPELNFITRSKMHDVSEIIQSNISAQFSLEGLARQVGTNDCTLKAMFKREFGQSVFQFIYNQRMEAASRCLLDTFIPIAEIGYMLGYDHPSHFTTAFRRCYGMSPREYREHRGGMK